MHPYTRALLAARPSLHRRLPSLPVIAGSPRSAAHAGPGCPYAARCPVAETRCATEAPAPVAVGPAVVSCHRAYESARGDLDAHLAKGVGEDA
ncbi:oligopeptide/dipeptide ABC transporter ATP-binding protein [Allocatelliglobosispora scoriae]|uniref:oligopeptide/dipeptide ABC transporter ATP-binding protein n=1 Tax=Allocatelliglobosispora scoriae TaxID=643052 RepID=UPI0035E41A14